MMIFLLRVTDPVLKERSVLSQINVSILHFFIVGISVQRPKILRCIIFAYCMVMIGHIAIVKSSQFLIIGRLNPLIKPITDLPAFFRIFLISQNRKDLFCCQDASINKHIGRGDKGRAEYAFIDAAFWSRHSGLLLRSVYYVSHFHQKRLVRQKFSGLFIIFINDSAEITNGINLMKHTVICSLIWFPVSVIPLEKLSVFFPFSSDQVGNDIPAFSEMPGKQESSGHHNGISGIITGHFIAEIMSGKISRYVAANTDCLKSSQVHKRLLLKFRIFWLFSFCHPIFPVFCRFKSLLL